MWEWLGNNSGQVQIIIALVAVCYVHYQIKLFKKQRYFELRLQLIRFIYDQFQAIKQIELRNLKLKKLSKKQMDFNKEESSLVKDFLGMSEECEEDILEIKKCLEFMLKAVKDNCNIFSIYQLEDELREAVERIEDIKSIHERFDRLMILIDK